jgi:hypothetical protein
MTPPADTAHYKNHRFPTEIISHGVWLGSAANYRKQES